MKPNSVKNLWCIFAICSLPFPVAHADEIEVSYGLGMRNDDLRWSMATDLIGTPPFSPVNIESTDTTTRVGIKFIIKRKDKETHPVVGIANETVDSKDELAGTSTRTSRVLLLVGLTGQF